MNYQMGAYTYAMTERAQLFSLLAKGAFAATLALSLCLIAISSDPDIIFMKVFFTVLIILMFAAMIGFLALSVRAHTYGRVDI
jgi:hypothetical protein